MATDESAESAEVEMSLTQEEAGWVESIRAAKLRLFEEATITPDLRPEVEEELLRVLGFRAPCPFGGLATPPGKKDDKAWLSKQQRLGRWFRYLIILHDLPGARKRLERYGAGDDTVNLKLEAWLAGDRLFREIGGGRSPVTIRKTIQSWGKEFGTHDPELNLRFPVPTGDPPVEIYGKNDSPKDR